MTPRLRAVLPARLLVPLAAVGLLITGCSSAPAAAPSPSSSVPSSSAPSSSAPSSGSPSPAVAASPSTAAAAAPTISIRDFRYAVPASVPSGAALQVVNEDRQAHTVTLGGGGDGQVVVQGGKTVTLNAPAKPGTYSLTCDFHGDMRAQLVVS